MTILFFFCFKVSSRVLSRVVLGILGLSGGVSCDVFVVPY